MSRPAPFARSHNPSTGSGQRIVLVTTSGTGAADGREAAGAFLADFVRALEQHDAKVTIVSPCSGTRPGGRFDYPVPLLPLSTLSPLDPSAWPAIARTLRSGQRATDRAVQRTRATHVLALWALPSGYWARQTARRHGIGFSTWTLGSDIWTLGKIPIVRQVLGSVMRDAAFRFADGMELASDVQRLSGRPCQFLPTARRLARPDTQNDGDAPMRSGAHGVRLGFLGRWHANKGIDLLIDALSRLTPLDRQRIDSVRIAGGGPLHDRVHAGVAGLRREGYSVRLDGYLGAESAAQLIAGSDLLIIPSRRESIPIVFSDAMQLGTPVVSTPVGDLPALIERYRCGVVARRVDATALAAALATAVRTDLTELAARTWTVAQVFDPARAAEHFLDSLRIEPTSSAQPAGLGSHS